MESMLLSGVGGNLFPGFPMSAAVTNVMPNVVSPSTRALAQQQLMATMMVMAAQKNMAMLATTAASNTPEATKPGRRLYLGKLEFEPAPTEESLREFFDTAMKTALTAPTEGTIVTSAYVNKDRHYGFLEFRSLEEASAGMQLDGISYNGHQLQVKRPTEYNAAMFAARIGKIPDMNTATLGLVSTQVPDSLHKVFCGGLPYAVEEGEVKALVSVYGALRAFHMVMGPDGQTKGYCFFEYADPSVTDDAIAGLNGMSLGERTLNVRRAQSRTEMAAANLQASLASQQSRILVLRHMITAQEAQQDEEYSEILEDVREEMNKYGAVDEVIIPRAHPGLGKVIVAFTQQLVAVQAKAQLEGRKFAARSIECEFLSEDKFARRFFY